MTAQHTKHKVSKEPVAKPAKKSRIHAVRQRYTARWPLYAAIIFTVEAVLAIAIWSLVYGAIRHRPVTAQTNHYKLTVLSTRTSHGDATFHPGDGFEYIVLNVEVFNESNQVTWVAPVVQTYLQHNSSRYGLAPATVVNPFIAGQAKPQQQITGELSYVVPNHTRPLAFCFAETPGGSDSVCLPLTL